MKDKDLEKCGKQEDIVYEVDDSEKNPMTVQEASLASYQVERIYTYEDYLNWPEDERVELIDGKIYYMSAPSEKHQQLLRDLALRFGIYLHGKSCTVYFAPFDVRIDLGLGKDSVVQPDLVVICDLELLDEKGLNGPPTLVIEIMSPSNPNHDKVLKYNKYLACGVKEYWIIDPRREEVSVNLLRSGYYKSTTYVKGDRIKVSVLNDLFINVTDLFKGHQGEEIIEVERAREEEKIAVAKKLLEIKLPIHQIAASTELSIEQIQGLKEGCDHKKTRSKS